MPSPDSVSIDLSAGKSHSISGRAAQTSASAPSSATLVPNSVVCGAIRSYGKHADRNRVDTPGRGALGVVFGIGDHEEQEDEDLGRRDEHPPEVGVRDRAEVPARRHGVPAARATARPRRELSQKQTAMPSMPQPRQDREPAHNDDREREHEPGGHRPPPEVEWLRALAPEQEEAEHEAEVGRVEEVPAAVADHVLREQRDGGGGGEDPRAVQAPPVAVLRARHAQDEGDAVPGQQRARRPQDHVLLPERDPDLEHAQVNSETRICAIESRKSNATCPSTWNETITAARWRRGSRNVGNSTGYALPRICTVGLLGPARAGALMAKHGTERGIVLRQRRGMPVAACVLR